MHASVHSEDKGFFSSNIYRHCCCFANMTKYLFMSLESYFFIENTEVKGQTTPTPEKARGRPFLSTCPSTQPLCELCLYPSSTSAGPRMGLITPSFSMKGNGSASAPKGVVPARPAPQPHPKDEDSLVQMAEHIPAGTRTPMCAHCNMVIR